MKPSIDGSECPVCGLVFLVLQVPWPHTGEWERCKPRRCPHCGAEMKEGGR